MTLPMEPLPTPRSGYEPPSLTPEQEYHRSLAPQNIYEETPFNPYLNTVPPTQAPIIPATLPMPESFLDLATGRGIWENHPIQLEPKAMQILRTLMARSVIDSVRRSVRKHVPIEGTISLAPRKRGRPKKEQA
jgi:hypothetical protein